MFRICIRLGYTNLEPCLTTLRVFSLLWLDKLVVSFAGEEGTKAWNSFWIMVRFFSHSAWTHQQAWGPSKDPIPAESGQRTSQIFHLRHFSDRSLFARNKSIEALNKSVAQFLWLGDSRTICLDTAWIYFYFMLVSYAHPFPMTLSGSTVLKEKNKNKTGMEIGA